MVLKGDGVTKNKFNGQSTYNTVNLKEEDFSKVRDLNKKEFLVNRGHNFVVGSDFSNPWKSEAA